MSAEFEEIDHGWKNFVAELRKLEKDPYVKVGFQKDEKHESGEDLALIASANEFGTQDGRIPERSFMRSTFDENKRNIDSMVDKGYDDIIKGKTRVEPFLNKLGVYFKALVQKKIVDLTSPPNAESTIARKGSSNPLIDTGFMRQSVKEEVVLDGDK